MTLAEGETDVMEKTFVQQRVEDMKDAIGEAKSLLGGVKIRAFYPGRYGLAIRELIESKELMSFKGVEVRQLDEVDDISIGVKLMKLQGGIKICTVQAPSHSSWYPDLASIYYIKDEDYAKVKKLAAEHMADKTVKPLLSSETGELFKKNTLDFLVRGYQEYEKYGIPFRRGLILTGPPGNGKTMACRWLIQECMKRRYHTRVVTPDMYLGARQHHSVSELFRFEGGSPTRASLAVSIAEDGRGDNKKRGVIVFDDVDIALRNREGGGLQEGWDQAMFLNHLEGIDRDEGVIYIFTTNTPLENLDPAICRPGRIDVVLRFDKPEDDLIEKFVWEFWPETVREKLPNGAHELLSGMSYAEIDEVRRLFVLNALDTEKWDWDDAVHQFVGNRDAFNEKMVKGLSIAADRVAELEPSGFGAVS